MLQLLDNVVQKYEWGSRTAIAQLQGRPVPSESPEAELWMGAHPAAPSRLRSSGTALSALDPAATRALLGPKVGARFGSFPFLLKVLAAETPLSIQAHPSKAQAEAGFAAEEARGISRSSPQRNYKDANHKPELLCALTRFEALSGFRSDSELLRLLDLLGVRELEQARRALASSREPSAARREAFRIVLESPADARASLVRATVDACRTHASRGGEFARSLDWALRLAELYPDDIGVVSSLFLKHLTLEPGEAIYLAAGNLHAYLSGVGIEIMASSDNVLRGGLTPKHVDVPELLRVLDFDAAEVTPITAQRVGPHEAIFRTPAPDFALSRIELAPSSAGAGAPPDGFDTKVDGPEILLCVAGNVTARAGGETLALTPGDAALVFAAADAYSLSGAGTVFRARVGAI